MWLVRFAFIVKHRDVWPVDWICAALNVSHSGFNACLTRSPSQRLCDNEAPLAKVRMSFLDSDGTAARDWPDMTCWPSAGRADCIELSGSCATPRCGLARTDGAGCRRAEAYMAHRVAEGNSKL